MRDNIAFTAGVIFIAALVGGVVWWIVSDINNREENCRNHGGIIIENICMTSDSRRLEW